MKRTIKYIRKNEKIKDSENKCKQKTRRENEADPKIYKHVDIKCGKCEYSTTSRQGLKIHNTKVHSKINFEEFPAACDICDKNTPGTAGGTGNRD